MQAKYITSARFAAALWIRAKQGASDSVHGIAVFRWQTAIMGWLRAGYGQTATTKDRVFAADLLQTDGRQLFEQLTIADREIGLTK